MIRSSVALRVTALVLEMFTVCVFTKVSRALGLNEASVGLVSVNTSPVRRP